MTGIFRWLIRIFVGLVAVGSFGLFITYQMAARSLPDYDEDYQLPGLSGPVEIVRDNANVPHIFADQDSDVFFGLGFAHAQDRLWQMMMMSRTAQGRLSEIFGPRTLDTDELLRRLDLYTLSVSSLDVLNAPTRAALAAYSSGVNAWLAQVNEGALGRGAPEFFVFSNVFLLKWM